MAYLSVENLEKAFGGTRVLRDVSCQRVKRCPSSAPPAAAKPPCCGA